MIFKTESGKTIDTNRVEKSEQDMAEKFIEPHDVVLELGARYGTVSCIIAKKLSDPFNLVAVEPQVEVQDALVKNRDANMCYFPIYKGFVSKRPIHLQDVGYGSTFHEGAHPAYPCISVEELQEKYNLKFDTIVADCEGGLEIFFDDHEFLYKQVKKVLMEKDRPEKCNYEKIHQKFLENGLQLIHSENGGFHEVWKRI